jgi:hypothetical protein
MYLSNESLVVIVIVGVIAGWLAGRIGGIGYQSDKPDAKMDANSRHQPITNECTDDAD